LINIARALLQGNRRKACRETEALPEGNPRPLRVTDSLLRVSGKEVDLGLVAERLVTAAQGVRGQMNGGEWELMEVELSAKLAALVRL